MAKAVAYVSGVALAPGVSRNNRLYTRDAIAGAVKRAQVRLEDGARPINMYTHHETTNTRELVGRITRIWQEDDGSAKYVAAIADTGTGRDIASLVNPEGDEPAFLRGVSIRGNWVGATRRERGPDGTLCEAGSDLEIGRLDWTSDPGVLTAGVDSFRYADTDDGESGERYAISESAPEALLETAIAEEATPAPLVPGGVREALRSLFGEAISGGSTPPVHKRDSGLSDDTGRKYADPGYQADHRQRYDISTKAKAKAAWSYVNQADNAKAYSAAQLKRVKGRIRAALKGFGVAVAAEGWSVEAPLLITEALVEYYGGDPESCGSYSLSATNGPTTVTVCSYGLDPAELRMVLAQACTAASAALCSIDPDMDGDIDIPGAEAEDDDNGAAALRGESAEDTAALVAELAVSRTAAAETASDSPAPEPDAAHPEGTEVPAVSETTTQEAAGTATAAAPASIAIPQDVMDEALRKAAKKAAKKALAAKAAESAPAAPVTEAKAETDDERIARIVEARLAAARPQAVAETEDERINRIVEARLVAEKQALTESGGGPGRKGLVTEHSGGTASSGEVPADFPMKDGRMIPSEQWTEPQRRAVGAQLEQYVLGSRASQ
jgi:hypothetical protein